VTPPDEVHGWAPDEDPWAGMVDENGYPFEIAPAAEVAAADLAAGADTPRLFNLPEEFWGTREIFKLIRRQAHANCVSADAVLGAALARASAMVPHRMSFDSGREGGSFNIFANIVAPSGIGKTEAMRSAQRLLLPPTHLTDLNGETDFDKFRDGVGLGSGEGLAEVYMGTVDRETGEVTRYGPDKGQPKTKPVRAVVRHNAFLFLDEGESLTKMLERKGATVGQTLRTAWTGAGLGAANAQESTTRWVPEGTYSMGLLIGWQPRAAQALISEVSGGTPQRFLWLSGVDPSVPDRPEMRPDPWRVPFCDGHGRPIEGVVQFPAEIKDALWATGTAKVRTGEGGAELDSHEPLTRCKLAALLCLLDGRLLVDADDWRLAGMIWAVSCAVRDRLVAFGEQEQAMRKQAEHDRHVYLAEASEVARIEVSERVVAYARQVATKAHADFELLHRSEERRGVKSTLRKTWDAGVEYALARGWIVLESDGARIGPGDSEPS
jgi:hypothetical protein